MGAGMEKTSSFPLHIRHVMTTDLIINRVYMFVLGLALLALFYYRFTTLLRVFETQEDVRLWPYMLICLSELLLALHWVLHQAFRWVPVTRTVYPERLPEDDKLPPVDVFIFTADPAREPSLGVMNTVVSAMALDYPPDKLAVYLSDDGGSDVTRQAVKDAWEFAKHWLPFCNKYKLDIRCPQAYFSAAALDDDDKFIRVLEYAADKKEIQERYQEFKERLERNSEKASSSASDDHEPIIEVMNDAAVNPDLQKMPILVYVAREKRPSKHHNFKAGAINVLIRVSSVISNAPYMLVLDCDHYCNDPTSVRQAMCFYLDPEISPKLAWVQFPQRFYNISVHDIYDARVSYYFRRFVGFNGLQGPCLAGCNFIIKREVLYGIKNTKNDDDLIDMKKSLGQRYELIKPVHKSNRSEHSLANELRYLASCAYESQTQWGEEVGFVYHSVLEDVNTSKTLFSRGWISVFLDPPKPCFLGASPTRLSDILVQNTRWNTGFVQILLSKHFVRLLSEGRMWMLQFMCYAALLTDPIYTVSFYIIATVPQICLVHGIPLYPKVSDPYFTVFIFVFVVSQLKHVQEVVSGGKLMVDALYELRFWMMKSATCYMYATLGGIMDRLGLDKAQFNLTSKVVDEQQTRYFHEGVPDFRASPALVAPLCTLYIVNLAALGVWLYRVAAGSMAADELCMEALVAVLGVTVNYPVLEGMVLRKDSGRVALSVCAASTVVAITVLCLGSVLLV